MASDAMKLCLLVATAAAGIALVAVPWVPATVPNTLPAQFDLGSMAGRSLLSVLQWHDEACMQADLVGFHERVTAGYARLFTRRLLQLGRSLDATALRAYVGPDKSQGLAAMAVHDNLGGWSAGDRACFVVGAMAGLPGVQGIVFQWDGKVFRLDAIEHQPSVDKDDPRAIAAFARRLVGGP